MALISMCACSMHNVLCSKESMLPATLAQTSAEFTVWNARLH